MLLDRAAQIILATGGGDQAGLRVPAHDLAVEIEAGPGVLPERALADKPVKVFPAPGIDLRVVNIHAGRQINFRLAHMEKAERIARRHGAGLLRGHDIVRQLANLVRQVPAVAATRQMV